MLCRAYLSNRDLDSSISGYGKSICKIEMAETHGPYIFETGKRPPKALKTFRPHNQAI